MSAAAFHANVSAVVPTTLVRSPLGWLGGVVSGHVLPHPGGGSGSPGSVGSSPGESQPVGAASMKLFAERLPARS